MKGSVNLSINNGIGKIEFFHPQSNSLPTSILRDLASTIHDCGKNEKIKIIIFYVWLK